MKENSSSKIRKSLNVAKLLLANQKNSEQLQSIKPSEPSEELKNISSSADATPYLSANKMKDMSIILILEKDLDYFLECIDSIIKQCNLTSYEILVGVNNSLEALKLAQENNNQNIKYFWFDQNISHYVIRNSLVDHSSSDNILFFDANDIMSSNMINDFKNIIANHSLVKFKYNDFTHSNKLLATKINNQCSDSTFGIKKSLFNKLNGFEPWDSMADVEFHLRAKHNKIFIYYGSSLSFHKRTLNNKLDNNKNATIKQNYINLINKKIKNNSWSVSQKQIYLSKIIDNNFHEVKLQSVSDTEKNNPVLYSNNTVRCNIVNKNHNQQFVVNNRLEQNNTLIKNKYNLSIIIPAFNAASFLNDCLDSIANYPELEKIQILIGIDACQDTLKWATNNKEQYKHVDFFWFDQNVGPYVIKNTLINFTKSDNILFFDADDIICNDLIPTIINNLVENLIIKFKYYQFNHIAGSQNAIVTNYYGEGVFAIHKNTFLKLNGFENWKCAADTEFHLRAKFFKIKNKNINKLLFYRRMHDNNLTRHPSTNYKSSLRKNYVNIINSKIKKSNWKVNNITTYNATRLFSNVSLISNYSLYTKPDENFEISVIIPAWKAALFLDDCINSITKQISSKIKVEILIGIDDCNETLEYVQNNIEKYNNIQIYSFNENLGPYIIRNTLASKAKYKTLLFFDADDVMSDTMISSISAHITDNNIVRFKYYIFENNDLINIKDTLNHNVYSAGQFAINKNSFLNLNGFEPWRCSADTEFIYRAQNNNLVSKNLDDKLFYRRKHLNSITALPETYRAEIKNKIVNSDLRSLYKEIIENKKQNSNWLLTNMTTSNNYTIINTVNNENIQRLPDSSLNLHGKIHHIIPWTTDKNIGKYYNECMCWLQDNDWACFIDGDAVHTTTFFGKNIEETIKNNPEYGLFTCYTNRVIRKYQIPPNVDWSNDSQKYHREIGEKLWSTYNTKVLDITDNTPALSGVLICINKYYWTRVGGFKEEKMLSVDQDIHLRFKHAGLKVGLMQGIYVQHWYRGGNAKYTNHLL